MTDETPQPMEIRADLVDERLADFRQYLRKKEFNVLERRELFWRGLLCELFEQTGNAERAADTLEMESEDLVVRLRSGAVTAVRELLH